MIEQRPPRVSLRIFTLTGRLLLLATVLVFGGMFYVIVVFVDGKVESNIFPGSRYPVALLLIPGVIWATVLIFVAVSSFLASLGVRLWRKSDDPDHHA